MEAGNMGQRPRELTPHASAQHYWGAELRSWRVKRGLSLDELGQKIHRDRSYLSKIELGKRPAPADLAADCDRALDAADALVRLHRNLRGDLGRDRQPPLLDSFDVASSGPHVANPVDHVEFGQGHAAPWEEEVGEDITVPARTPDGKVVLVSVPRRLILKGLGVAAAVGLTGGPAPVRTSTSATTPDVALAHFERLRATLADSDNLFGPSQVIPAVQQQLSLMRHLTQPQQPDLRHRWMRVQTEFADLAGWLAQDSGDHRTAGYWMDRALEWAYQTGDMDDVVFILTRKAQLALDMRNGADAVGMAEAAMRISRPRSRLAAISATFAGHGHALQGNTAPSAHAYDQARELLTGADTDQSPWGQFFGTSYLEVWEAGSRAVLGDYRAAAAEYRTAIDAMPAGFRRDSGLYLAREALAHAGTQDVDQAAAVGLQALTIGTDTGSGRIMQELGNLNTTLGSVSTPKVGEFRDALAQALPTHQV
jgi:transcriptional regulator with XRE-family HTH domain